jgi:HD-GYP domain-containing protein (c-di-GMP phosphodiesterase class II)
MLEKIAVRDLTAGMHLHELCGTWLDHPFWKTRFTLGPGDLVKLRQSGVTHCWVDRAKSDPKGFAARSSAPAIAETAAETAPEAPIAESAQSVVAPEPLRSVQTSLEEELVHAASLIKKSREAVRALFSEARMGNALDIEKCLPLVNDIAESVWRNPHAVLSLARLKTHDDYSYMHSVAVCALMVTLARQLGQNETEARSAGFAGLLHDIGKASVPLEILNKPAALTDEEYALVKTHPRRGHEALSETAGASAIELDVCLHHHERLDGRGYPEGLAGAALSIPVRMGAVCDVYDAITSDRPYKAAWGPAEAMSQMAAWAKSGQFDFPIFQAFVKSVGIYPVGSLVRLSSGRLGVVIEQHAAALLKPVVKVFFSAVSQMHVRPETLDLARLGCDERVVERESNRKWKFKHLEQMWAGDALLQIGR